MRAAGSYALAAAVLAAYLGSHVFTWSRGFWSGDSGCKLILVESILRSAYRDFGVPYPGRTLDPAFSFVPLREPFARPIGGELFLQYSPVFAIVSSVPYRWFGFAGLFVVPLLSGLAALPAVGRLAALASTDRRARPAAVLLAAFATPCWFYSLTFWEMTPAVCLATWAAVFALRAGRAGPRHSAALAGGLMGLAIWFRDDLYVLAPAMAIVLLRQRDARRALPRFAMALLASLAPLWAFQAWALGHPLGLHFGDTSSLLGAAYWAERGAVLRDLLVNAHPSAWVSAAVALTPLLAWAASARLSASRLVFFAPAIALAAALSGSAVLFGWIAAPNPVLALLDSNSLFSAAPFAALAFVRWRPDARDKPAAQARSSLRALLAVYATGYALLAPAIATRGIHWGCRLLLAAYPLLATLSGVAVAEWWSRSLGKRGFRALAVPIAVVIALSVAMQGWSLHLLRHRKSLSARLNRAVAERPEEIVIASGWPVPQELAQVYFAKTIFLVDSSAQLRELATELVRAGYERAVRVSWPPAADAREETLVADPWSFPSFEVRPVRLNPPQP